MNGIETKLIKASAGTGKTYRLSLEYIGLLLKYHDLNIHYSEILVITFTKKATSEIRDRIFEHLEHIINMDEQGRELAANMEAVQSITITDSDRAILKKIHEEMLVNKTQVRISTIDAFTNEIFKTIISPFLGVINYEIDNNIHPDVFAEIYDDLMQVGDAGTRSHIHGFFARSGKKTINDYQQFIESLLYNRWIFDFLGEPQDVSDEKAETAWSEFRDAFGRMLTRFEKVVHSAYPDKTAGDCFKMDFIGVFDILAEPGRHDFASSIMNDLDPITIADRHKLLLSLETFWDGSKLFRAAAHKEYAGIFRSEWETCRMLLAEFILFRDLMNEQNEILQIARRVFAKYDEIKLRDKRYTHNDVSYYTFKYLYHPDLSLIDGPSVTNLFYEYLAAQIRFVLIDEFQDTSMIQYKILLPIINEITSGPGVREYGGVIIVGDEKQSIYGWRGGERDLLLSIPNVLYDCREETLGTSFRSNPRLLAFINDIFTNGALHPLGGIEWPYKPVNAHKSDHNGHVRVMTRNYSATKEDGNTIASAEEALREFVTETLAPLIRNGQIDVKKSAVLARKNSDLQHIAAVLDELGIDYILESSGSILQHRSVRPLIMLYRFIVYRDPYDLLRFLRSDLVLLSTADLKQILLYLRDNPGSESPLEGLFTALASIPVLQKIADLYTLAGELITNPWPNLLLYTQKIIEAFNITGIFGQENDLVNLNRFLEIMADFSVRSNSDRSLENFLDYCKDNEQNERFRQIGLKEYHAITLLTIHKAKGLEFDNVFLYWNLSSPTGNYGGRISYYLDYEPDYSTISSAVYTLNYDHIIPHTRLCDLKTKQEQRQIIEELNTLYVAITRAKTNLFLQFAFKKKGGLPALIKEIDNNPDKIPDRLLLRAVLEHVSAFRPDEENDPNKSGWRFGDIDITGAEPATPEQSHITKDYISFDRKKTVEPDPDILKRNEYIDYKSVYLENRDIDKGNIVHFYLSHIRFGGAQEFDYARKQTLNYFGNLLPLPRLRGLMTDAQNLVNTHPELYDPARWDRVFTEYTLFSPTGRELRLDRLMIDLKSRQVMIVDYKTGDQFEPEQLDQYIDAVRILPVCQQEHYQVKGQYVQVAIIS